MKKLFLDFLRNLAIMTACVGALYLFVRDAFDWVYGWLGSIYGPAALILMLVVMAIPGDKDWE
ncbi:hypothetical protein JR338_10490 [Chloroflexota bacterium]|nr:hypothetical protein JR338_10490 [Chloroflexota bacterium]